MKRLILIFLAAAMPWVLAAEPESPTVQPSDAPEVTDPDLKESAPPMRQGSEEPVGGWSSRRKGRSALSLGWDQHAVLGWTYWLGERFAVRAGLGGAYSEGQGAPYTNDLSERVALRCVLASLGGAGHLFGQVSAGARQRHSFQETQTPMTGFIQFDSVDTHSQDYSAGLDLGVEVFWPSSQRVSLEVSTGLVAAWSFSETRNDSATQPGSGGPTTSVGTSTRSFGLASRFGSLAVNIHF